MERAIERREESLKDFREAKFKVIEITPLEKFKEPFDTLVMHESPHSEFTLPLYYFVVKHKKLFFTGIFIRRGKKKLSK
ncbi:MAG: hypothetical protein DRI36_00270 [Caldiserica bacterium]|nr:MAG: hypothetical protein DRI36_00270 [Caldisericota bacterium]